MSAQPIYFRGTVLDPLSDDDRDALGEYGHPTTRRYPRTLHGCDAAFTRDAEYADPITRDVPQSMWDVELKHPALIAVYVIGAVAVVSVLAWLERLP